eukprot:ANDGO_00645.mRNA.1 hypothetical protein
MSAPPVTRTASSSSGGNVSSHVLSNAFLAEIENYDQFETYLTDSLKSKSIIVIDCFLAWAGPCQAVVPTFKRLILDCETADKPVRWLRCDVNRILASVVTQRSPAMIKKRHMSFEDLQTQQTNVDVLKKYSKSCKPTFLMYFAGKLKHAVEGVDVIKFEKCFRQLLQELASVQVPKPLIIQSEEGASASDEADRESESKAASAKNSKESSPPAAAVSDQKRSSSSSSTAGAGATSAPAPAPAPAPASEQKRASVSTSGSPAPSSTQSSAAPGSDQKRTSVSSSTGNTSGAATPAASNPEAAAAAPEDPNDQSTKTPAARADTASASSTGGAVSSAPAPVAAGDRKDSEETTPKKAAPITKSDPNNQSKAQLQTQKSVKNINASPDQKKPDSAKATPNPSRPTSPG